MNELHVRDLVPFVQARPAGARALLLDVREPWEVALAPLQVAGAQALHVPLGRLPAKLDDLSRTQPIVCICHHGVRSRQAVAFLVHAGFESVYNLAGGVDAWSMEVDPAVPRY
jgi:rhodanese-related sulfurtransferase